MDISIIIVNYNSKKLLYDCINSILISLMGIEYEIIIVDNNSSDGSLDLCKSINDKRLVFIDAKQNLGFAKANNLGVKNSSGRLLHFLNPDTEVNDSLVNDYKRVADDLNHGIEQVYVNPMKDLDGTIYYGKNYLPDTFNYLTYLFNRSRTKWYYIGATVIMSRVVYEQIGGWNERFFMYEEDTDLFYKICKHNIPIIELPSVIFHRGGGTSNSAFSSMEREILIQKSLRIYFDSNHLSISNYIFFQIMMILSFSRKPQRAWWQMKAIFYSYIK